MANFCSQDNNNNLFLLHPNEAQDLTSELLITLSLVDKLRRNIIQLVSG
jgi:hypothetical protein